ncbi:MAG: hypothetical protein NTV01_04160 [Bacteroidia bacterium]|nr:hypothetical protein [Bacteroidia bacterium]
METRDLALMAYLELRNIPSSGHRFEGGTAYFSYSHPATIEAVGSFFADEGQFKTYHQKLRSKKSQIDALKGVKNERKTR